MQQEVPLEFKFIHAKHLGFVSISQTMQGMLELQIICTLLKDRTSVF